MFLLRSNKRLYKNNKYVLINDSDQLYIYYTCFKIRLTKNVFPLTPTIILNLTLTLTLILTLTLTLRPILSKRT